MVMEIPDEVYYHKFCTEGEHIDLIHIYHYNPIETRGLLNNLSSLFLNAKNK